MENELSDKIGRVAANNHYNEVVTCRTLALKVKLATHHINFDKRVEHK